MNPVRAALAKKLKEDPVLKELATGGVHYKKAGSNDKPPYVIFHKAAGNPLWSFGDHMDKEVWVIKGVGEQEVAEDIDLRCKDILNGATLAIEGKVHQDLRHISDVNYDEADEGEVYNHVGAEYKLDSEKE